MFKHFISFLSFCFCFRGLQAQSEFQAKLFAVPSLDEIHYPQLVSDFYKLNNSQNFWLNDARSRTLRKDFLNIVDSALNWGLDAADYHFTELHKFAEVQFSTEDSIAARRCDVVFTDAAIAFLKNLHEGNNNKAGYDELSSKCTDIDNAFILNKLINVRNAKDLRDAVSSAEPLNMNYFLLKEELQKQATKHNSYELTQLRYTLNYLRWINHFRFQKYIVVNIPSATLNYYQGDTVALSMKVVAGKPSTKTPRFAAYCNKVILYPYWNVPASIAVNELLPLFKKNHGLIKELNMQVLDKHGKILNAYKLNWSSYTKYNFPYSFRQSTGCDNALGVMKFNLTDPFSVYMHDTNNKSAFLSERRFYSHGCIRIEKPLELANYILPAPVDSSFVLSCVKDQQPVYMDLVYPVPIFVIYSTTGVDAYNKVAYYKDVYRIFKK